MMTSAQIINYVVVVILALVSSTGGWGLLQMVMNRRGLKASAAKEEAEAENKREEAEQARLERIAFLQDVERKAYEAASKSADERYKNLESDYDECRSGLREIRQAVRPLLIAVETIMARISPTDGHEVTITVTKPEVEVVRRAVEEARTHLS